MRQRRHDCVRVETMQHVDPEFRAADSLFSQRDRGRFEMGAGRIDVGRVPQTELEIDRRANPHDFSDLVVNDESAEIIRDFHVEIERHGGRLADCGELRQREIGRNVKGRQTGRSSGMIEAGFAAASMTEPLKIKSGGSSPCFFISPRT